MNFHYISGLYAGVCCSVKCRRLFGGSAQTGSPMRDLPTRVDAVYQTSRHIRRHTIETFSVFSLSNRFPLPARDVVPAGFRDDVTEFPAACVGVQLAERPT